MSALRADDVVVRGLDPVARRDQGEIGRAQPDRPGGHRRASCRRWPGGGGGLQMKVRGLRELFGSLKINYEAALRSATTPEPGAEPES